MRPLHPSVVQQRPPSCASHTSLRQRDLHSLPTRRSSDLMATRLARYTLRSVPSSPVARMVLRCASPHAARNVDRKSTRLNSSHVKNSYAVFCLKKKNCLQMRDILLRYRMLTTFGSRTIVH